MLIYLLYIYIYYLVSQISILVLETRNLIVIPRLITNIIAKEMIITSYYKDTLSFLTSRKLSLNTKVSEVHIIIETRIAIKEIN